MILRVGLEFVGERGRGRDRRHDTTASPTTTLTPSSTNTPADRVTIDITIADGKVSPNGDKVSVKVGQKVVLIVTSDKAEEIHAHTADADGYALDVPAGKKRPQAR